MTQGLWFKKVWNGRSKGISTVLATMFLTLVVFAISTNVFLWTISENARYTQVVKDENQKNVDRLSENVVASGANYSVSGDEVTVKVTLSNAGSVAAQIINLWVFDTNASNQRYTNKSLDLNLNPGEVINLRGLASLKVTIPGADASHEFVSWLVTARGNTVPVTETEGTIIAQAAQGIGSIGMDFGSFVYYNVVPVGGGRYGLQEYPNGLEGFVVPGDTNIAFRVILTNYDAEKRTISFNSHSVLWMIFPTLPQQVRCAWWYIVNVDDAGTIEDTFSSITLPYGVPTMIYFASETDLGDDSFSKSSSKYDGSAAVNLMLFGTIGSSAYGQNIPFVSVYVT